MSILAIYAIGILPAIFFFGGVMDTKPGGPNEYSVAVGLALAWPLAVVFVAGRVVGKWIYQE